MWLLMSLMACGPSEPPELVVQAPIVSTPAPPSRVLGDPNTPTTERVVDPQLAAFFGEAPRVPTPLTRLTFGMSPGDTITVFEEIKHPNRPPFRDADAIDPRILLGSSLEQHVPGTGFTLFVDTSGPGLTEIQLSLPQVSALPSLELAWGAAQGSPPSWTSSTVLAELHEGGPGEEKAVLRLRPAP